MLAHTTYYIVPVETLWKKVFYIHVPTEFLSNPSWSMWGN